MESLDTVASRLCTLLLMCAGTLLTAAGDGPAQNTSPNTTQAWPPFLAGQWSGAAARSPDGGTLYVCNRFKNCVSVIDVASGQEVDSVAVQREPVAMALGKDGKLLLVANFLQNGRADHDHAGSVISVIDTAKGEVIRELLLPDGSGSVTDLELSPDGKYAVVTELLAQFKPPAVALEMRWINGNAVTLIDVGELEVLGSVLLDDRFAGAANPSAAAWSGDGEKIVITHAGTHEVSIIDFQDLLAKILNLPAPIHPDKLATLNSASNEELSYANYLRHFPSARKRVKLPKGDLGPRSLTVVGKTAYVTNYFSDTACSQTCPRMTLAPGASWTNRPTGSTRRPWWRSGAPLLTCTTDPLSRCERWSRAAIRMTSTARHRSYPARKSKISSVICSRFKQDDRSGHIRVIR